MRRGLALLMLLALLLTPAIAQAAASPIRLFVGGSELKTEVPPVIEEGRTLVPLRALSEALGFTVAWDEASQSITLTRGSLTIRLTIDKREALVNGSPVPLDVPPMIRNDRTLIPVRFVATQMGAEVGWDADCRWVRVALPGQAPAAPVSCPVTEALNLLKQADSFKDYKATGQITSTIGSVKGSLPVQTEMTIYARQGNSLVESTARLFGLEQKSGQAYYKGEFWSRNAVTGAWVKVPASEIANDAMSNPAAYAAQIWMVLDSATVSSSRQDWEGTAMTVVKVEIDLPTLIQATQGATTGPLPAGTLSMSYWLGASGFPHHVDYLMNATDAEGLTMSMEGTLFYQPWEQPIPFPAEILQ